MLVYVRAGTLLLWSDRTRVHNFVYPARYPVHKPGRVALVLLYAVRVEPRLRVPGYRVPPGTGL